MNNLKVLKPNNNSFNKFRVVRFFYSRRKIINTNLNYKSKNISIIKILREEQYKKKIWVNDQNVVKF